jgi:hypothetical protein
MTAIALMSDGAGALVPEVSRIPTGDTEKKNL